MMANLHWDKMEADVTDFIIAFPTYQRFKKSKKKYGKLLPQEITMISCETVYIDLVGTYTVTDMLGQ